MLCFFYPLNLVFNFFTARLSGENTKCQGVKRPIPITVTNEIHSELVVTWSDTQSAPAGRGDDPAVSKWRG